MKAILVFFAEKSPVSNPNEVNVNKPFRPYASSQGFIKYNFDDKTTLDPFKKYYSLENELYKRLEKETNKKPFIVKPFSIDVSTQNFN